MHDRYPAYISWETFERMQAVLDDNYATYEHNKRRGIPRQGAALLQGLVYCGRCGHKMVVQYKGGNQYLCNALRWQTQAPVCQRLRTDPVDQQVVRAFFEALAPAELDLYAHALGQRRQHQVEVDRAQHYTLQRLEHAADQARRRYEEVDPATAWWRQNLSNAGREAALHALQEAREQDARLERSTEVDDVSATVPPERAARGLAIALGQALPTLWQQDTLSRVQRKSLLRCLIDKVVLDRQTSDTIAARIVWRGDAVSELVIPCTVGRLADLSDYSQLETQILRLESQGRSDEEIAQLLTAKGSRSSQHSELLPSTVQLIRIRPGGSDSCVP